MEHSVWHDHYDAGVSSDVVVPELPLFEFLTQAAKIHPEKICTRFLSDDLTYAQVDALSGRVARNLVAAGLKKGDCVGISLPNIPQFIIVYFGALKAGGVVAAINPRYGRGELKTLLRDVAPKIIFSGSDTSVILRDTLPEGNRAQIILTEKNEAAILSSCLRSKDTFNKDCQSLVDYLKMEVVVELPVVSAQDDCIYQYSGGTTGTPKAAVSIHRALVANSIQFRSWLTTLDSDKVRTVVAIPLYHVYGMVIGMCVTLSLGGTMILHDSDSGMDGLIALINDEQATLFPAVPYLLEVLLRNPAVKSGQAQFQSLKAVISGASPLRVGCWEDFSKLISGRLVEGYGLSEAPTATHCNPLLGEVRPGTIGLPLPGVDARIVSLEDGQTEMPTGEVGELILHSPQVMRGYLNRPDESEIVLKDGWLYTGDIARVDADGYFTIVDRKKDLIKVAGFQVWPYEIETVLGQHPEIEDACVVGVPDVLLGERVLAWLVMRDMATVSLEEVQHWCKHWLASYKTPSEIRVIEKLPRSALGKLLRRELRLPQN